MYELKTPPKELKDDLPPELFQKAQHYGKDKTRYSVIKTLVDQLVSLYLIRAGIYHRAWSGAGELLDAFGFTQDYTVGIPAHRSSSTRSSIHNSKLTG
jgi:STE24 endopeptidase